MTPEQRKAARERVNELRRFESASLCDMTGKIVLCKQGDGKYRPADSFELVNILEAARETLPTALDHIDRLHNALIEIGKLTRWVGWVEEAHPSGGEDMRAIKRIVEKSVGGEFSEYT